MLAVETKAVGYPAASTTSCKGPSAWNQIVVSVTPFLEAVAKGLAEQVETFDPEVIVYARYALTSQGKQLRPALVALSAKATGRVKDPLVTIAVIIEMVHLATLVHDDIMDEAVIRRRRPTLAAHWGSEISVLLGDALFAHALQLAAGFPTPEVCRAVASATKTVCSGEILQTHRRRDYRISREEYFKILEMKTAELFALSCELGAWSNHASPSHCRAMRQYGLALGTAYQIYDDCIDLFGSETNVGKSLGTDLASGKLTLPLLVALDRATPRERSDLEELAVHWAPDRLGWVLSLLEKHDALRESRRVIDGYLESARRSVAELPDTEGRAALLQLTDFLAEQTEALGT